MPDTVLEQLPPTYAAALLLEAAGLDGQQIGTRLNIPVESVPTLLEIARAKLASAAAAGSDPDAGSRPEDGPKENG